MTRISLFKPVRQRGFSIVELMVAVVVGMLALLFATQMITGNQRGNQAAVSGSDAMQNGMLAMFSMSNDASEAGYGLNDTIVNGCDTTFLDKSGYTLAPATRSGAAITPLSAAVIQSTSATASDTITLYSGSSPAGTPSVRLITNYTGGTTLAIDREPTGFNLNDVILVAPDQPGGKCSLAQLSATPPVGATNKTLVFDAGTDYRFNSGGLNVNFTGSAARAFNLGPASSLSFHTWSVANGFLKLRSTNLANGAAAAVPVADNIVAIKAMYGFDTRTGPAFAPETGTKVGLWSATMIDADGDGVTGGASDYQRIVSLRIAVVARSKAPERAPVDGSACTATTAAPTVFNANQPGTTTSIAVTPVVAVAGDTVDWHCYHYRVFETIVPLRNAAWRPTAWAS